MQVSAGHACCSSAAEGAAHPGPPPCPFLQVSLVPGGALRQALRVKNTGADPFEFTCALHTYFAVSGECCLLVTTLVLPLEGPSEPALPSARYRATLRKEKP